jgi:hypothetical protein
LSWLTQLGLDYHPAPEAHSLYEIPLKPESISEKIRCRQCRRAFDGEL